MPWLRLSVVPALLALLADERHEVYVTQTNGDTFAGLPESAVVEQRCWIDAAGPRACPLSAPPAPRFVRFLNSLAEFERLAVAAAGSADRAMVARALAAHPFAIDREVVARLVHHVLTPIG
jgi:alpha-galactosidase/6-phospho-beta-glucosidase family protein